jgi:hypothetical protein
MSLLNAGIIHHPTLQCVVSRKHSTLFSTIFLSLFSIIVLIIQILNGLFMAIAAFQASDLPPRSAREARDESWGW